MYISNPRILNFSDGSNGSQLSENFKLLSKGDVICKYAKTNSPNSANWHCEKKADDEWVKYSFDGGATWLLKFKFRNTLQATYVKPLSDNQGSDINPSVNEDLLKKGTIFSFDFSTYSDDSWQVVRKAIPNFYAMNGEGWMTSLPLFRMKIHDDTKTIEAGFLNNLPSDTVSLTLKLLFDGGEALALFVENTQYTNVSDLTPAP